MSTRVTSVRFTTALSDTGVERREDHLVGEEPLQVRACGPGQEPIDVAVTMRTPGAEEELAAGFLITEGLVTLADLEGVRFTFGDPGTMAQPENEITVHLKRPFDTARVADRHFIATASCGICGKASVDDIAARCEAPPHGPVVAASTLLGLPAQLRQGQEVFGATGGLHGCGLFTHRGSLVALREDVGRHNALDKLVGAMALAERLPLHDLVLLVSGRVSFEIVQKAGMAGVPLLAAVGAPTDLSVATAERLGMTLVGFLRDRRLNAYTGVERLDLQG